MPVFIAGDFNEEPQNAPIDDVMESEFVDLYSLVTINKKQNEYHQPFTTFKYRKKEGWIKRTIDYIFIQKNNYYKDYGVLVESFASI